MKSKSAVPFTLSRASKMKISLSVVLFLIAVLHIGSSVATNSAKSRERRSPNPGKSSVAAIGAAIVGVGIVFGVGFGVRFGVRVGVAVGIGVGVAVGVVGGFLYPVWYRNPGKLSEADVDSNPGKKSCIVHIRRDLVDLQPVFIKDGSLMIPTDGYLNWAHGETTSIACPPSEAGTHNSISTTNNKVETITCDNGLMFQMNGRPVNISTITCDRKVTGNYQPRPDPECVGTNKAIGFNVPGDQFYDLFHSCYDEKNAVALYTTHVLYGSEIDHKSIYRSGKPNFRHIGISNGTSVSSAFTQLNQKARLVDLFSVEMGNQSCQEAERYIYNKSYLQRGHLTPDADELFTTWQCSTYFFVNVAAMWRQINIGNWKKLESKVRTLANYLQSNLEIYTGTYGTLALCSSTNYCPDFTLVDGRVPVPKWLWKIVKAPTKEAAIALVVSNNPFLPVDPICGSSEVNYGWHEDRFDDPWYGKVSYCSVQELRNSVGYIPQAALAKRVLQYL